MLNYSVAELRDNTMIQPKITVVTVCYNIANFIEKLLVDGLYLTSKGYEFIGDLVSQTIKN